MPPLDGESVFPYHQKENIRSNGKYLIASLNRFKVHIGAAAVMLVVAVTLVIGVSNGVSPELDQYEDGAGDNSDVANPKKVTHPSKKVTQPSIHQNLFDPDPSNEDPVYDVEAAESESSVQINVVEPSNEDPIMELLDTFDQEVQILFSLVINAYDSIAIPAEHGLSFEDEDSPQHKALRWTVGNKNYDTYDDERRLQRYALAAFFYSTYAKTNVYMADEVPWSSAEDWLSEKDECEWEGIKCNQDRAAGDDLEDENNENHLVTYIYLPEHRLSGSIPIDLALLKSSLTFLILSKNDIYMEGNDLDVFQYLDNVKSIHLDDNYIAYDSGLPNSLRGLSNLQKINLSYNLLQGDIPDGYFSEMKKLSHLEIESNYLSGTLPSSLREKRNLVYLYIRRNSFQFDLEETLQNVQWHQMFSLWLDGKNITGLFPSEIGKLTDLASLSITDSSIAGPIPTELGRLTELRRGWFYGNGLTGEIPAELGNLDQLEIMELHGNNLEGDIPQGICDAVANAGYEFKKLSIDCDKVDCDDCCTSCY